MLSKQSIAAVLPVVKDFTQRNAVILPIPGTPLSGLISTMAPNGGDAMPADVEELRMLSAEDVIVAQTTELNPETDEVVVVDNIEIGAHEAALQAQIVDVAEKMRYTKQAARTEVMPACRELFADLEQRVADIMYAPTLLPTVVMSYYPDFYNSDIAAAEFGAFNLEQNIDVDASYVPDQKLAYIPGDQLRTLLTTGNNDIDMCVAQALGGVTDAALEDIYNHFFRGSMLATLKDEFLVYSDAGTVGFYGGRRSAVAAFFCWVWATTLEGDIQDGNSMSLENYEAKMQRAAKVAMNGMVRIQKDRALRLANGELILEAPSATLIRAAADASEMKIFVNADNYITYLHAGGSAEAITGAVLSGRQRLTKEEMLSVNQVVMHIYSEFAGLKAAQQSANRLRAYALSFRGLFVDKVLPQVEDPAWKDACSRSLTAFVEGMTDSDIANLQRVLRTQYVMFLYPESNINRLLNEIDTEMQQNPELTVFQAATKAEINMLCDFYAQQMQVVGV